MPDLDTKLESLLTNTGDMALKRRARRIIRNLNLKPEDKIIELQKKVDESLKNLFKKERDFEPHITLCRVKHPEDKKSFVEEVKKIRVDSRKIEIKDFRLVKSTLSHKGPVYEDLEVFNLIQ